MFAEGIESRFLVVNLLRQLEQEKIITPEATDEIFKQSIIQATKMTDSFADLEESMAKQQLIAFHQQAIDFMNQNFSEIQNNRDK